MAAESKDLLHIAVLSEQRGVGNLGCQPPIKSMACWVVRAYWPLNIAALLKPLKVLSHISAPQLGSPVRSAIASQSLLFG